MLCVYSASDIWPFFYMKKVILMLSEVPNLEIIMKAEKYLTVIKTFIRIFIRIVFFLIFINIRVYPHYVHWRYLPSDNNLQDNIMSKYKIGRRASGEFY